MVGEVGKVEQQTVRDHYKVTKNSHKVHVHIYHTTRIGGIL